MVKKIFLFGILLYSITHGAKPQQEPTLQIQYTAYTYMIPESKLAKTWKSTFGKTQKVITNNGNNIPQLFAVQNSTIHTLDKKLHGLFAGNNMSKISTQCALKGGTCGGGGSVSTSKPNTSEEVRSVGNISSEPLIDKNEKQWTSVRFSKASSSTKDNLLIKMDYSSSGLYPEVPIQNMPQNIVELNFIKNIPIKAGYSQVVIIGTKKDGMVFGKIMLVSLTVTPK
jgi:hypothetical protein